MTLKEINSLEVGDLIKFYFTPSKKFDIGMVLKNENQIISIKWILPICEPIIEKIFYFHSLFFYCTKL